MTLKNLKSDTKTQNQLETKNLLELRSSFLGNLKVEKHLNETSLTK